MSKPKIGWIGTGIMGKSMCGHLLDAGYQVTVTNRTLSKCQDLVGKGARVVHSPAEVAQDADIVCLIVGYPRDVREVVLGEGGVLSTIKKGGIIIDMTTSEPSLAREIYDKAAERGISVIDAPVSGGDVGAQDASLSIFIGGDTDAVATCNPVFEILGKQINHMGPIGSGQHTKVVNQVIIATAMIGVVEGLLYAHKSGLDMHQVIQAVSSGAAGSWSISHLGPRIASRNFKPGGMVEYFLKDMGIALKEARQLGLSLPGLALANQLYLAVKAQGYVKSGTHALMLALEHLNGIDPNVMKN